MIAQSSAPWRRVRRIPSSKPRPAGVVHAALLLALTLGCGSELPEPEGERTFSLLAVGDTGAELDGGDPLYLDVAEAIAAEDAARPADALALLGDNFYPSGLRADELVERVSGNLVGPYCRFVAAAGPWRILVAHAPLVPIEGEHDYFVGHRALVTRILAETKIPVQLVVSGHDHNLQITTLPAPGPALGAIAGGGCCPREVRTHGPSVRFAQRAAGFARVDRLERDGRERLAVSLFEVPERALGPKHARRVAVWSVDLEGRTVDEGG